MVKWRSDMDMQRSRLPDVSPAENAERNGHRRMPEPKPSMLSRREWLDVVLCAIVGILLIGASLAVVIVGERIVTQLETLNATEAVRPHNGGK